jgi:hypothetical protein
MEIQEDGTGWYWAPNSISNFTSYWEFVWSTGGGMQSGEPASVSFDCQLAPNTVLSMYRAQEFVNVLLRD